MRIENHWSISSYIHTFSSFYSIVSVSISLFYNRVPWEGSNKLELKKSRWTVAVWLVKYVVVFRVRCNRKQNKHVSNANDTCTCVCVCPSPHSHCKHCKLQCSLHPVSLSIYHEFEREVFDVRCYFFKAPWVYMYLTYKMFYDCLIWSILTLFIIWTKNTYRMQRHCNAITNTDT